MAFFFIIFMDYECYDSLHVYCNRMTMDEKREVPAKLKPLFLLSDLCPLVHQPTIDPLVLRVGFFEIIGCFGNATAAAGGKGA